MLQYYVQNVTSLEAPGPGTMLLSRQEVAPSHGLNNRGLGSSSDSRAADAPAVAPAAAPAVAPDVAGAPTPLTQAPTMPPSPSLPLGLTTTPSPGLPPPPRTTSRATSRPAARAVTVAVPPGPRARPRRCRGGPWQSRCRRGCPGRRGAPQEPARQEGPWRSMLNSDHHDDIKSESPLVRIYFYDLEHARV